MSHEKPFALLDAVRVDWDEEYYRKSKPKKKQKKKDNRDEDLNLPLPYFVSKFIFH